MDLHVARENMSLKQQVIDRLRGAIVDGMFTAGQKLIEKDLCVLLGVSRPLLREALQRLDAEGLITNVPHKGPVVTSLSWQDASEIYEVRKALEALAAEGFALHASEAKMLDLRESLTQLKRQAAQPTQGLLQAKNRFYEILLEGCANKVIANVLTQLNNRITLLRRLSLSEPGRIEQTLAECEDIVRALEQRNAPLAKQLCHQHVATAAQIAMKRFQAQNGPLHS